MWVDKNFFFQNAICYHLAFLSVTNSRKIHLPLFFYIFYPTSHGFPCRFFFLLLLWFPTHLTVFSLWFKIDFLVALTSERCRPLDFPKECISNRWRSDFPVMGTGSFLLIEFLDGSTVVFFFFFLRKRAIDVTINYIFRFLPPLVTFNLFSTGGTIF